MFESLESREFMSVTLMTTDGTAVDTQPASVTVDAAKGKVKVSEMHVAKIVDKASAS